MESRGISRNGSRGEGQTLFFGKSIIVRRPFSNIAPDIDTCGIPKFKIQLGKTEIHKTCNYVTVLHEKTCFLIIAGGAFYQI